MSKKRKANESNLPPVQSKRTEIAITASVAIPTAPLSAFAAARAKAKLDSSDPVVHDEIAHSISVEMKEKKNEKRPEVAKPLQPRTLAQRKEKVTELDQDDAIDEEDVFSQLASSSRHSMPEPYKLPNEDQEYESDVVSELETAEVAMVHAGDDERIVQMSSWSQTKENCVHGNSNSERIAMNNGQTLSVWGQYRLQVLQGLIIIAGTFLAAEAPALEVYAPLTSSIPVLKCIKSEGALIEISSIRADEHTTEVLNRVSPLYSPGTSAIWCRSTDSQQSFSKVRHCLDIKLYTQLRNLDSGCAINVERR